MADVNVEVGVVQPPSVTVSQATSPAVSVSMAGAQGPQGPQGTTGPQGPAGSGDKTYSQAFNVTTSVTVTHNLGKYPAVTVVDSAGDETVGQIDHQSTNQLTVTFAAPFSGVVYCN